jgi:hypothetical protein
MSGDSGGNGIGQTGLIQSPWRVAFRNSRTAELRETILLEDKDCNCMFELVLLRFLLRKEMSQ